MTLSEEYVTRVLGINRRMLNESTFDSRLQEAIVREHLIFEGWWSDTKDAIVKKLEDNPITSAVEAAKKFGEKVNGVIVTLTSIVNDGGDAIETIVQGSKSLMSKNFQSVTKSIKQISGRVKELSKSIKNDALRSVLEKSVGLLDNMVGKVVDGIKKITSGDGWKVMLTSIACFLATSAIRGKIDQFSGAVLKVLSGDPREMLKGAIEIKKMIEDLIGEGDEDADSEAEGDDNDSMIAKSVEVIVTAMKNFMIGFVKKVIGEVGMTAIEQLAGPLAWIKKLGEIFEKIAGGTSWVCEKIMDACKRATFKPISSPSR